MEEINFNRNQKLYLSNTPIFVDASSIISSSVKSEDPDVKWLTKLLIKYDAPILEKLKKDTALEKENKKLKKALFEQRLLTAELQNKGKRHLLRDIVILRKPWRSKLTRLIA